MAGWRDETEEGERVPLVQILAVHLSSAKGSIRAN